MEAPSEVTGKRMKEKQKVRRKEGEQNMEELNSIGKEWEGKMGQGQKE